MSPSFVTQATRRRFIVASSRSAVGIGAALLLSASVFAQDTRPTSRPDAVDRAIDDAETVIITATRTRKSPLDVPATTWTVDVAELEKTRPVRSLSDALEDAPSIHLQKTTHIQNSPFIRGLTGYHTLLMVDGIRLNDSVLRAGPNDLWGTVDPRSIGRLEVVYGSSSVLYGSDSMGGTVNILPKSRLERGETSSWERRVSSTYQSALNAFDNRAEIEGNIGKDFGWFVGGTIANYGNVRAGGSLNEQPKTGYDLNAFDGVFDFALDTRWNLRLIGQSVEVDDAMRTHQTLWAKSWQGTTVGTDKQRMFDFGRDLVGLSLDGQKLDGAIDHMKATVSYQNYQEDGDRIRANDQRNIDGFDVDTWGIALQFDKKIGDHSLTFGGDWYRDSVDSWRFNYAASGALSSVGIQGPVADDASYDLGGLFIQDAWALNPSLSLIGGLRATYASVDADRVASSSAATAVPTAIEDDWVAVVASLRAVAKIDDDRSLYGGWSQGFRAPNLSDLTRLDIARTNELEVPSPGLSPEHANTFEVGVKGRGTWTYEVAYYYTLLDDIIIRRPTGVVTGGLTEAVKSNDGDGFVQGVDVATRWTVDDHWSLRMTGTWMDGALDQYPTSSPVIAREPLSRMAPLQATLAARWTNDDGAFWLEPTAEFVSRQTRLTTADRADTSRIPPGGTPGYGVLSLYAGWRASSSTDVFAGIENILDKNYRVHGSGLNEPGTNFVLGFTTTF